MPPGGAAARGDQLAVLAGLAHALLVAPEVAEDLDAAEADVKKTHAAVVVAAAGEFDAHAAFTAAQNAHQSAIADRDAAVAAMRSLLDQA